MEDFEFLKRLNKKVLTKLIPAGEDAKWLEPFNYEKIFEPKKLAELRKLVGGAAPVGSEDEDKEVSDKTGDDDLPFDLDDEGASGSGEEGTSGDDDDIEAESIDDLLAT